MECISANEIVHLDLKPANIIVGDNDRIKVIDFGISEVLNGKMFKRIKPKGTPLYMCKYVDKISVFNDKFSLIIIIYELFIGYNP